MIEKIKSKGFVEILVEDIEKKQIISKIKLKNTILNSGKSILSRMISNNTSSSLIYINSMDFGEGGESEGVPKVVTPDRTSLFTPISGVIGVSAIGDWNSSSEKQAVFSSTITTSQAVGRTINEAALKMSNGELFSMITFGGLSKTSSLQFTLNWTIIFS